MYAYIGPIRFTQPGASQSRGRQEKNLAGLSIKRTLRRTPATKPAETKNKFPIYYGFLLRPFPNKLANSSCSIFLHLLLLIPKFSNVYSILYRENI